MGGVGRPEADAGCGRDRWPDGTAVPVFNAYDGVLKTAPDRDGRAGVSRLVHPEWVERFREVRQRHYPDDLMTAFSRRSQRCRLPRWLARTPLAEGCR